MKHISVHCCFGIPAAASGARGWDRLVACLPITFILSALILTSACRTEVPRLHKTEIAPVAAAPAESAGHMDPALELLASMDIREKIGQMLFIDL